MRQASVPTGAPSKDEQPHRDIDRAGVYIIYCKANGKAYIGSSKNYRQRFRVHVHGLRKGTHGNQHLQNAWNLYGHSEFTFSLIQNCLPDERLIVEQWYLDMWVSSGECFNRRPRADSPAGTKWTEEERRAKSVAMKANPPFAGRKHTAESKALLSEARKEWHRHNEPSFKGRTHTEEVIEKIREVNTGNKYCVGRKPSEKCRKAVAEANSRREFSAEKRAAISAANSGKNNPRYGVKLSEEQKAKAVATRAANRAAKLGL